MSFAFQYNEAALAGLSALQDVFFEAFGDAAEVFTHFPRVGDQSPQFPQAVLVSVQEFSDGEPSLYRFSVEEDGEVRTVGYESEGMYWIVDRVKPLMEKGAAEGWFAYPAAWAGAKA